MRIEEEMTFPFEFTSPVSITLEETKKGVAIITGTLIKEGVSKNGNIYTIEQLEEIAKQAEGIPIYYGVMTKRDPNTGLLMKNMHANIKENKVGRIIKAWLDKASRKVKFIAEVVSTPKFPNLIKRIKSGWGVSIGGIATKAKYVMDEAKRILLKILKLKLNHVQLLSPQIVRGMDSAKVEGVTINETMIVFCDPVTGICTTTCKLGKQKKKKITLNLNLEI